MRPLGIPTVEDRVAQTIVKTSLEKIPGPIFHEDPYGYRPRRSALDAIGVTGERCWKYDWVLEFDVKGMFDNMLLICGCSGNLCLVPGPAMLMTL